jgi:hypothetical protein
MLEEGTRSLPVEPGRAALARYNEDGGCLFVAIPALLYLRAMSQVNGPHAVSRMN